MKIGIIICDRYRECAGGKCFRAARNREGGFARYSAQESLEVVGYTPVADALAAISNTPLRR